jgi:tetratricopeptide (TPR) repeat protein
MTEHPSQVSAEFHNLDSIWNPLNAAASESTFQALLPAAYLLTHQNRCYLVELLIQIARTQTIQRKLSESRKNLEEAEKILNEDETLCQAPVKIRYLLEKGRLYMFEKTPSQSRIVFEKAYNLAKNSGEDHFVVEVAQMMAMIEPQKSQQDWIVRAIEIAEKSPQEKAKRWLGGLYASLGWKLYDLRRFDACLEIFQKSLSHLKIYGTDREVFVAKWSIGKVLRIMNQTEDALVIQKALLAELGIGGIRDGRLYEELAECLQTLERTTEAQLYFELAYRELSNDVWVADNQPLKLKRMKDLGKVKEKG